MERAQVRCGSELAGDVVLRSNRTLGGGIKLVTVL